MKVYVVEIQTDDPYYGWNLVSIYASEEEAKKHIDSTSTMDEYYRYRAIEVIGA